MGPSTRDSTRESMEVRLIVGIFAIRDFSRTTDRAPPRALALELHCTVHGFRLACLHGQAPRCWNVPAHLNICERKCMRKVCEVCKCSCSVLHSGRIAHPNGPRTGPSAARQSASMRSERNNLFPTLCSSLSSSLLRI